ncbi:potassium channel family protein [Acidimicrobiia bacterium EGI L10123]|uniref:potassium channel family protein n=1 Tax=Salinilacustrithrix flava TaxID=2957203 RepID=UPI003D7C1FF4|nr:potassium channel family protein [Acidimicrobiia bacterium EGI L10123]
MRDFLLVGLGCLMVALVVADVFRTVLWSGQGAGPLTGAITALGRRALPLLSGDRRLRSAVGPVALLAIVATWTALLLTGFTLMLEGQPDAIRTSGTKQPVDWFERAYFVGYSLFTLGNGDLAPATDFGRVLAVAVSATGLFLLTLSVTYLLPVISASVASRSFASSARALGDSPEDVVLGAWDGTRIQLDHQLRDLAAALGTLAEQHLAYPVLHLFQSSDTTTSAPLAVADLDDLLTLLDGVDPPVAPLATPRRQLRSAIATYLETYGSQVDEDGTPTVPRTHRLDEAGIALVDRMTYERTLDDLSTHRKRVRSLVGAAGVPSR